MVALRRSVMIEKRSLDVVEFKIRLLKCFVLAGERDFLTLYFFLLKDLFVFF